MSIIKWIEQWFADHCNEDWEHQYGITINTLDNPGWDVAIALKETELENLIVEYVLIDNSDDDWFAYKVENSVFYGYGDPTKLEIILQKFREIAEKHYSNK
jgi:hypothetical protein